jgi:hypothetical protein
METDALIVPRRSLTILNERGDTTITWEPDKDAEMEELIAQKMAAGVHFYTVVVRKPGQRGRTAKPKEVTDAKEASKYRALSIPDADFSAFVLEGKGSAVASSEVVGSQVETVARAKTPKEAASGHTVAVKPRRGG